MDGDDYTWNSADSAAHSMAQDLATVDTRTVDQRIIAQLAAQELRILKLEQHAQHADAWLHKLLNPNGDGEMPTFAPTLFDDPQDGI
jgi:hypothetical protein